MFDRDLKYMEGTLAKAEFLKCLYDGDKVGEACSRLNVNPGAVAIARKNDEQFDMDIRHAQAFQVEQAVDRLDTVHDECTDALMARVISDNIKWLASKRMRQIYGDKLDVVVEQKIDLKSAIAEARKRTIHFIDVNAMTIKDNVIDIKSAAQLEHVEVDPLS